MQANKALMPIAILGLRHNCVKGTSKTAQAAIIFILVALANILLARFAALTISNVPGVVTFFFAVAFMIPFALWFGAWGATAAYVGCFIGSGIPRGLALVS